MIDPNHENEGNQDPGTAYHVPVLLQEVLEGLAIQPEGVYVDCTMGGGGHSRAILAALGSKGRLICFDQDADARGNMPDDPRVLFIPENFRHLDRFLRLHEVGPVDGVLADLGVSSHQFDEAERGFSIRFNADLDMRMDRRQELTAMRILNEYEPARLHKLFEQYGEVTNSKTLAHTIAEVRQVRKLRTIEEFRNAVHGIVKGNPNKYFAQVFQALRMEVNDETGSLKEMLEQLPQVLKKGGRAAIISFHSIEDRLVKTFFRDNSFEEVEDHPFESRKVERTMKVVNKKPITASDKELKSNPRSRSAKLRVAERV